MNNKNLLESIKRLNKEKPLNEGKIIRVLNPAEADAVEQHEEAKKQNTKRTGIEHELIEGEIERQLPPADADAFEQHEEAKKQNSDRLNNVDDEVKDLIQKTANEESRHSHYDVINRKDLAKLLNEAKKDGYNFKVSRNLKEGFRYSVELFKEKLNESYKDIKNSDLKKAYEGSWYTILGCGGSIEDWKKGYQEILNKENIGTIKDWIEFTGKDMNEEFNLTGDNKYPDDLKCLAFSLDALDISKLAILKLKLEDRWFDDIVDNNQQHQEDLTEAANKEFIKKCAGNPDINVNAFNNATNVGASSPSTGLGESIEDDIRINAVDLCNDLIDYLTNHDYDKILSNKVINFLVDEKDWDKDIIDSLFGEGNKNIILEGFADKKEYDWDYMNYLRKELDSELFKNEIGTQGSDVTDNTDNVPIVDLKISMTIDGDWKHDHLFGEDIVEKFCEQHNFIPLKHTQEEIGESETDSYEAYHCWYLMSKGDDDLYSIAKNDKDSELIENTKSVKLNEELKVFTSSLEGFEPSIYAKDLWDEIVANNKIEDLEFALESIYPDGISDIALDDLLHHEADWIRDLIDLPESEEIELDDDVESDEDVDPDEVDLDDDFDIDPVDFEDEDIKDEVENEPEFEMIEPGKYTAIIAEGEVGEPHSYRKEILDEDQELNSFLDKLSVELENIEDDYGYNHITIFSPGGEELGSFDKADEFKKFIEEQKSSEEIQNEDYFEDDELEKIKKLGEGFVNNNFKENLETANPEEAIKKLTSRAIDQTVDEEEDIVDISDDDIDNMLGNA